MRMSTPAPAAITTEPGTPEAMSARGGLTQSFQRRTRAGAVAAVAVVAALLGGCTASDSPTPVGPTASVDPEANVGYVIASSPDMDSYPWVLSTSKDDRGQLCMNIVLRPDNENIAETCGLPDHVGNGYTLASVAGVGSDVFYFAPVADSVAAVRLTFAAGGSVVVPTKTTPAQVKTFSRFFVLERPKGPAGAATVTLLASGSAR